MRRYLGAPRVAVRASMIPTKGSAPTERSTSMARASRVELEVDRPDVVRVLSPAVLG